MGLVRDKSCKYANKGDYLDRKKVGNQFLKKSLYYTLKLFLKELFRHWRLGNFFNNIVFILNKSKNNLKFK